MLLENNTNLTLLRVYINFLFVSFQIRSLEYYPEVNF